MVYIIDNKEYSTLKQYFFDKHPDHLTVTENEVSHYVYHTVPEIRGKNKYFIVRNIIIRRMEMYVAILNSIQNLYPVQLKMVRSFNATCPFGVSQTFFTMRICSVIQ